MTDLHNRFRGAMPQESQKTPILDMAPDARVKNGVATMRLYEPIDSWGEDWGVSAKEFAAALDDLGDDVNEIQLHINSPGGEVTEGVAILNALRNHDARVVVTVDGLAASAASFIAMAADQIIMGRNTEMMIHDAWGICIGPSEDMRALADRLDQISDNIASVYADRAGGSPIDWRGAMHAETWYSAEEAVEAGLADRVAKATKDDGKAKARFDLSVFNHAGREKAPSPMFPARPAKSGSPENPAPASSARAAAPVTPAEAVAQIHGAPIRGADRKDSNVDFTTEQLAAARTALGLADDAEIGPDQILAGLTAPPLEPGAEGEPSGQKDIKAEGEKAPVKHTAPGTMTIDASAWEEREARIKRLEASAAKRAREERDEVIAAAVREGKFPPARKEHWARLWDADPEGTREVINGLTKNVIPVDALGIADDGDSTLDDEFKSLFPPAQKGA